VPAWSEGLDRARLDQVPHPIREQIGWMGERYDLLPIGKGAVAADCYEIWKWAPRIAKRSDGVKIGSNKIAGLIFGKNRRGRNPVDSVVDPQVRLIVPTERDPGVPQAAELRPVQPKHPAASGGDRNLLAIEYSWRGASREASR
jgi:hypothetical protein